MIYSVITGDHLWQSFGGAYTNVTQTFVYRKGAEEGTNILYQTDRWYEIDAVTTNGVAVAPTKTGARAWSLEVGRNASNDITVIASARVASELSGKYGLTDDNKYRDAVLAWLSGGRTMKDAFKNPDTDTPGLADFIDLGDKVVTNLSLTAMYWLDMDPTWKDHDLCLKGGLTSDFSERVFKTASGIEYTNVCARMFLMVSNTVTAKAWTPYVLRSATPGVTSQDYADAYADANWNWSNVTFKVTGILLNAQLGQETSRNSRIPLRYFVFDEDSFEQPDSMHPFTSLIELDDPYMPWSTGGAAGWYEWQKEHGRATIGYSFDIDDRLKPTTVEILKTKNLLQ